MFQNFIAKSKEAFSKKKIPLSQLIGYISKIPMLGKQMVREAAKRSGQRHKCSGCGKVVEVCVAHIIDDPVALLSDIGRERLQPQRQEATNGAVVATASPIPVSPGARSESPSSIGGNGGEAKLLEAEEIAILADLAACDDRSPASASPQPDAIGEETTTITATTTTANADVASPQQDAGARFAPNHFDCAACGGRLGVHCYPGDATNGSKQELMEKLFALFDAMPEVIGLKIPPAKVKTIVQEDIFWVD